MKYYPLYLTFAVFMMLAGNSNAALLLTFDKTAKTFSLTGSDTGTLTLHDTGASLSFGINNIGGSSSEYLRSYDDTFFTTTLGTPGLPDTGAVSVLGFANFQGGYLGLNLRTSTVGEATIAGTGVSQSYAGFAEASIARLESLNGQTMSVSQGIGFEPLQVQVIPEPSSALLLGLAALCLTGIRKRTS